MSSPPGLASLVFAVLEEAKRRMVSVAFLFFVIAIGALVVGMLMPKTWECSALLVPDTIKPLMDGRGGNAENQVRNMIQVVRTRRIMREVLKFGGWLKANISRQDEERLLSHLRSRLHFEASRDAAVRISYRDVDARRTFEITKKMVDIMIREAANAKETTSRETYEFVDKQVKAYGGELTHAHESLLAYYRSHSTPSAANDDESDQETPTPDRRRAPPRMSAEDLARLRAEEATLVAQLARTRPTRRSLAESNRAVEQLRARVEQLRFEYERLAASYTNQHPDVVRKWNDLEIARQDLKNLEAARIENERAEAATSALDDEVASGARARLEEVRSQLAAGTGRVYRRPQHGRNAPTTAANPVDPDMRQVGKDSKLSELLRRYETTRDVYQDLLKKRETARLALNLDVERSSVILKVQEPPTIPAIASGLRVMHKSIIGMMLAVAVPLGLLVTMVSFDGRVRSIEQIEAMAQVPILVTVPNASSGQGKEKLRKALAAALVVCVFTAYLVAFLIARSKVPH